MQTIEQRIAYLREGIEAAEENIGERLTAYRSECALYGDAGPGMHPSCWKASMEAQIVLDEAELCTLLATPEGEALQLRESEEVLAWVDGSWCGPTGAKLNGTGFRDPDVVLPLPAVIGPVLPYWITEYYARGKVPF